VSAFAEMVVPMAVAELKARSLGSDEDRAAWLEARTNCVTATEAKLLMQAHLSGNPTQVKRVIADLVSEKLDGSKFSGNHFTEWGKLREPFILAELERRYGLRGCGLLVHAEGNSRHAATPDGAGVNFDGLLDLAEIKTSKNDVTLGSAKFDQAGYLWQMQWQMYCTGALRVLYVVERHNDDWSGWDLRDRSTWKVETGPTAEPLVAVWVARDEAAIAQMITLADEALAVVDAERMRRAAVQAASAGGQSVAEVTDALQQVVDAEAMAAQVLIEAEAAGLVAEVVAGRGDEAAGKKRKETAWARLQAIGAKHGDFSAKSAAGSVRFISGAEVVIDVVDQEAAEAAHPKEWAQLERARKRAAELELAWGELAARHLKKEKQVGKASLTVTAARAKKEKSE